MQNEEFIIKLIFKEDISGNRLSPELMRLLAAYIVEILKEIQAAERGDD